MGMIVATALIPVFFVMLLGFFAGKRKIVDNKNVASINHFLMMFALPAALFTAIARTSREVILMNANLMLVLALSLLIIFTVMVVLQSRLFKVGRGDGAVQSLTVAFPNFASIGLPLLGSVYGSQGALPVAVAIAVGSVTISPLTLALLELTKTDAGSASPVMKFLGALRKSVSKPIFIAPMLAVIVALCDIPVPDLALKSLGLIGQATAGAGLFLTGLVLSAQPIKINPNVVLGVLLKNVIQPIVAYLIVRALNVPEPIAGEVVLLICIPAGFFGLVFGVGYGFRPATSGSTLVVSSLASIVTLTVAILLLAPQ
ncbi:MAG: AEC family transporter [Azospirillaceae bacterium]|nr:AEC family transporter [Azospirillaceae bacterium]